MEGEHEKAVKAIQGFLEREQKMRNSISRKERKILELGAELNKSQDCDNMAMKKHAHGLASLKNLDAKNVENIENDLFKQVNITIYSDFVLISTLRDVYFMIGILYF